MKTQEMIKALKEKGYKIEEPENKFLKVKYSEKKFILLENMNGLDLVKTWDIEEDLNDFEYFEKRNKGHFWINGDYNKFEFLYKGKWLICDEEMRVRFLK